MTAISDSILICNTYITSLRKLIEPHFLRREKKDVLEKRITGSETNEQGMCFIFFYLYIYIASRYLEHSFDYYTLISKHRRSYT